METTIETRLPDEVRRRGYRAVDRLGGHDFADTFRARTDDGQGPLVVKLLDVRQIETWKQLELFERQTETLESLDHPSIPEYVDSFQLDIDGVSACGLVYEFVEGTSLDELLDEGRGFGEEEVVEFLDEMLGVLDYLHGFTPPVVHRDLKPSNILRTDDGDYVLIDFGAVQTVLAEETGGTTFVGTNGYMPPEQMMGRAVAASDLYALGATAIHLASGLRPRTLSTNGVELEFGDHVDISATTRRLLEWLVDPDLEERADDAGRVRRALQTGRMPEGGGDEPGGFGGWDRSPAKMSTSCRVLGNYVELERPVPSPSRRGLAVWAGVLGAAPVVAIVLMQLDRETSPAAAIFAAAVPMYTLAVPVAIWLILRRRRRERLEPYLGTASLNKTLVLAVVVPWFVIPCGVIEYLSGRDRTRLQRLIVDSDQMTLKSLDSGGDELETTEIALDSVDEIEVTDRGTILVEADGTSLEFATGRCGDDERRWIREGLGMEAGLVDGPDGVTLSG